MKKRFLVPILALSIASTSFVSCNNNKDKELTSESNQVETTSEGVSYTLDQEASEIEWKGFKISDGEEEGHNGLIKFENADVTVKDGVLESGKFIVDMKSLESTDLNEDADMKAKLDGHLKNEDFFEVEKFPTATYEITKVTPATEGSDYNTVIEGNLTLKGITKPVQFNANVTVNGDVVEIATETKDINRQEFGVVYKSTMKDVLIKDEMNIQVKVKANAAK